MIYKFKSKASGDVIMLGPTGDKVLGILGRDPSPKGIIEPAAMLAAIELLTQAVRHDDELRAQAERSTEATEEEDAVSTYRPDPISLRQRVWPLVDMLQRCHREDEPIVWGV